VANPFHPRPDCPVPSTPSIEGSLVSSCEVRQPPQFPWLMAPPPPIFPPGFEFGCYKPSVEVRTTIRSLGSSESSLPGELTASIDFPRSSETGWCEPRIILDFSPGVSCPPKPEGSASMKMKFEAGAMMSAVMMDSRKCEWAVRWKGSAACPTFVPAGDGTPANPTVQISQIYGQNSIWGDIFILLDDEAYEEADELICPYTYGGAMFIDGPPDFSVLNTPTGVDSPACCTDEITVVGILEDVGPIQLLLHDSKAGDPPEGDPFGVQYELRYNLVKFRLPKLDTDEATPLTITLTNGPGVFNGFDSLSDRGDCGPCGQTIWTCPVTIDTGGTSRDIVVVTGGECDNYSPYLHLTTITLHFDNGIFIGAD